MAYAGVVPSEYSSGDKRRRGKIAKANNAHIRRIIIESDLRCIRDTKESRRTAGIHLLHLVVIKTLCRVTGHKIPTCAASPMQLRTEV